MSAALLIVLLAALVLFAGGALVAVKAHKDIRVEIGERVAMHVPLAACHLFDATTGERLRASP